MFHSYRRSASTASPRAAATYLSNLAGASRARSTSMCGRLDGVPAAIGRCYPVAHKPRNDPYPPFSGEAVSPGFSR